MLKKLRAFTLIELMIVVAIVGLLVTIAVPQYFKYLAKAKQTEVMVNLASLHTAQQAYFASNGRYTNVLWGEDSLGWRPEGYTPGSKEQKFYYTYGFNFSGAQEGVHYFTGKLQAAASHLGSTSATREGFVIGAAGDVQGKGTVDVWSVDQSRNIVNVVKGIE